MSVLVAAAFAQYNCGQSGWGPNVSNRCRPAYFAVRLNFYAENSWAVVKRSSGAIALDEADKLIMRLNARDAEAEAMRLSAAAKQQGETPEAAAER